ncbi:hypothetical protein V2J09_022300 [Rumex salicifolius]
MIRQSQLPPRAPLRSKEIAFPSDEPNPTNPLRKNVINRHKKSLSHSSVHEEQPAWMDNLLSDLNSTPGRFHSRSASDSMDFLDDLISKSILHSHDDDDDDDENASFDGSGSALESACVYGPNSPRSKVNVEFMGNSVLSALSDCNSRTESPFLQENSCDSWSSIDSWNYNVDSVNELNAEPNAEKRHPRQRSRVRKLQYIAELEKTVNAFQALESDLQYKLSTVVEQRLTLSMENNKLKQHMSRLQHKKFVLDGEYQMLQREAERLQSCLMRSNKLRPKTSSNHVIKASQDNWETLDWAKLHLG